VALLVANLIIMAVDAETLTDAENSARLDANLRLSTANASSKASGATSGFFQQIWNFRSTAQENEQFKERLTQVETELHTAQQASR
jgi:hypothetical protein